MIRKAFKLTLYPDAVSEYEKRHKPIWQELEITLKQHGVHNYSIFFDKETNTLFGYAEIESETKWNAIAKTKICQEWWNYMADNMATNPDNSPLSKDLKEVFHLR